MPPPVAPVPPPVPPPADVPPVPPPAVPELVALVPPEAGPLGAALEELLEAELLGSEALEVLGDDEDVVLVVEVVEVVDVLGVTLAVAPPGTVSVGVGGALFADVAAPPPPHPASTAARATPAPSAESQCRLTIIRSASTECSNPPTCLPPQDAQSPSGSIRRPQCEQSLRSFCTS